MPYYRLPDPDNDGGWMTVFSYYNPRLTKLSLMGQDLMVHGLNPLRAHAAVKQLMLVRGTGVAATALKVVCNHLSSVFEKPRPLTEEELEELIE